MPSRDPRARWPRRSHVGVVQPGEHRRVDAGVSQLERLGDVGDAEPVGAAVERGACDGDGAVAVGVRLDDGHDVRACRRGRRARRRWPDGVEVDGCLTETSGSLMAVTLRHDEGGGDAGVVAHREVHAGDALRVAAAATVPVQRELGVAVLVRIDDHVVPAQAAGSAERLDQRLLRGESGGERASGAARVRSQRTAARRSAGVRAIARSKRARSTTSTPMPTITRSALTRP